MTAGKFDGLHRGHRKLLDLVLRKGREEHLTTVVFTFAIAPQTLMGQRTDTVLMTSEERRRTLRESGIDLLVECEFTDRLRQTDPETFVRDVLIRKLKAACVVAGRDFRFGNGGRGTAETLSRLGAKHGYETVIVEKEKEEGVEICSTLIRDEILAGNMEYASRLLGYDYFISGEVVRGRQIGQSIGFPTANLLPPEEKALPPHGVYASVTEIGGSVFRSVTNIGTNPTVNAKSLSVETHIPGFHGELYGRKIRVSLTAMMRRERRFASVAELKRQLKQDVERRQNDER